MTRTNKTRSAAPFFRPALTVAFALGIASSVMFAQPAQAAKEPKPAPVKMSANFQKVAMPFNQALEAARKRPDVIAAKGNASALATALAGEKGQLDGLFAAIAGDDDKLVAGQLALSFGQLAEDPAIQRRGIASMLESGKAAAADVPKLHFFAGQLAFVAKDYAAARTELQAAVNAGYHENDADVLLAEAYIADNQVAQGLTMLERGIAQRKASGSVPEPWYRRGLLVAYKAKSVAEASKFASGLVESYPTSQNWGLAITIIREIGGIPQQDMLDLLRLMGRTNSYAEGRDYLEYVQAADPRRLPGEAQKVIESGIASGKLSTSDRTVVDYRTVANERVGADRASLPSLERDARAANATAVTALATGDAFLSYGDAAKAESMYAIALGKPGVDTERALTRLGIAQVDQGKTAEAQVTFAKISGARKPIAQLWTAYAKQKAGGAPPVAAAQ